MSVVAILKLRFLIIFIIFLSDHLLHHPPRFGVVGCGYWLTVGMWRAFIWLGTMSRVNNTTNPPVSLPLFLHPINAETFTKHQKIVKLQPFRHQCIITEPVSRDVLILYNIIQKRSSDFGRSKLCTFFFTVQLNNRLFENSLKVSSEPLHYIGCIRVWFWWDSRCSHCIRILNVTVRRVRFLRVHFECVHTYVYLYNNTSDGDNRVHFDGRQLHPNATCIIGSGVFLRKYHIYLPHFWTVDWVSHLNYASIHTILSVGGRWMSTHLIKIVNMIKFNSVGCYAIYICIIIFSWVDIDVLYSIAPLRRHLSARANNSFYGDGQSGAFVKTIRAHFSHPRFATPTVSGVVNSCDNIFSSGHSVATIFRGGWAVINQIKSSPGVCAVRPGDNRLAKSAHFRSVTFNDEVLLFCLVFLVIN